jgi:hypothetical protein
VCRGVFAECALQQNLSVCACMSPRVVCLVLTDVCLVKIGLDFHGNAAARREGYCFLCIRRQIDR